MRRPFHSLFPTIRLALIGAIGLGTINPLVASRAAETPKEATGFGEARHGKIPEGAAEMLTAETDRAINSGLVWLARQQNVDGSFGSATYRGNIAVTSLAGLAFMASGSSPGRGPYGANIDRALVYVMENTSPSGFIAVQAAATHGPMYSHGFGTLFLAEAYGMTNRPEIREKLQKAVRLIIDTQNNEGGGGISPFAAMRTSRLRSARSMRFARHATQACSFPRRRSRTAFAT